MDQTTNSSGLIAAPDHACLLQKIIYGAKQTGKICGVVLADDLTSWGFRQSHFDTRLYFLQRNGSFMILLVVVDDNEFTTNDTELI